METELLELKEGDKVIYLKPMKSLDYGSVGVLGIVRSPNEHNKEAWSTVTYEQNRGTNKVFSHSAKLSELALDKSTLKK